MSWIRWLCGRCMSEDISIDANLSDVHVLPTPGGSLVAVSKTKQTEIPCLSLCVMTAVIVDDHSHDNWDPMNSSQVCRCMCCVMVTKFSA